MSCPFQNRCGIGHRMCAYDPERGEGFCEGSQAWRCARYQRFAAGRLAPDHLMPSGHAFQLQHVGEPEPGAGRPAVRLFPVVDELTAGAAG